MFSYIYILAINKNFKYPFAHDSDYKFINTISILDIFCMGILVRFYTKKILKKIINFFLTNLSKCFIKHTIRFDRGAY